MRSASERRRAWLRGRFGEWLAAWHYRLNGFVILHRGWRGTRGEIDVVARRGSLLVIVEVRRREDLGSAALSITPAKRGRIERATEELLARSPNLRHCSIRYDVVLIAPGRWPRRIVDAWRARI